MTRTAERGIATLVAIGLTVMLATALYARVSQPSLVRHIAAQQPVSQQGAMAGMGGSEVGALMQKLSQQPEDLPTLMALATQLAQGGNNDAAATFAERALKVDPRNADALYLLGYVRHEQGRNEEAISYMEQSIALRDNAAVRFSAGVICRYYLHDEERALEHWRKGIALPDVTDEERSHLQAELDREPPAARDRNPEGQASPAQ